MPSTFHYPFRIFANQNLGTHYDYSSFIGECLPSKGTGQSSLLPEINLASGNVILKSTMVKTQEQIGNWMPFNPKTVVQTKYYSNGKLKAVYKNNIV